MIRMIKNYNAEVAQWIQRADLNAVARLDDFLVSDDMKIKWSRNLKRNLKSVIKLLNILNTR